MDAVVIAGGRLRGVENEQTPVTIKALLTLHGKTLLERMVRALQACRSVGRICVVGPPEVEPVALHAGAERFTAEGKTGIENLLLGLDAMAAQGRVLCAASDLPFVRPEDIEQVIRLCPAQAKLCYVTTSRLEWEAQFPGDPAFFVPLSDGDFTGTGVVILDATLIRALRPAFELAFSRRKSKLGMARLLGAWITLRLLLGRCLHRSLAPSTETARQRVASLLGCECAVIRGCSPRLARDVDDLRDWEAVQRVSARMDETPPPTVHATNQHRRQAREGRAI